MSRSRHPGAGAGTGAAGDEGRTRPRLSRSQVVRAAVALADESGLEALSMRKLGERLGVEAMSLYKHVANKDDLLDGMVDAVFAEFGSPVGGDGDDGDDGDWRDVVRRRAVSVRTVLARHPWAAPVVQSRAHPGPTALAHLDALIGVLRGAGFPVPLTAHALSVVDAYVHGFAVQERALPFDTEERSTEVAQRILAAVPPGEHPHFVEFSREHVLRPGYDHGGEFEWGLDLVLDGLERAFASTRGAGSPGGPAAGGEHDGPRGG
ncbi:TetR/AcrR family transcriptional regulator C-terminal domain-containing protein [Kineococcus radiotolerans]|uniref:Transcriptional regulator, TetR family n=1 Tax=Kineococcus radiotolerans (strain ATCC BAA-149 / DSM 14245 / SRS30216) TaxID=266940 RepID=A6WGH8_KINRD|nr:TetR/AcrR family transcriptional regulator C-terminal domain-containing protein [Kineococcus radiotolerans]ABS05917.1 transcriptional regulator, TetR family [Kineococcus radiotolerans SRS30216 = ATCC BAA-149]